ncbi:MAG: hypothetical protein LEGION0403_FIIPPAGN_02636 [Legionella sp.]
MYRGIDVSYETIRQWCLKLGAHFKNRIILAIHITTGTVHDSVPYLEQLDNETIADRAYGSGYIISSLRDKKITTYIPLFSSRSGSSENNIIPGFQYSFIITRHF